jgi:hypothetical protein
MLCVCYHNKKFEKKNKKLPLSKSARQPNPWATSPKSNLELRTPAVSLSIMNNHER